MNNNTLQIKLNKRLIDVSSPIVMGILNVTPNSFYKSSRIISDKYILSSVEDMLTHGAKIIDVGGYSTRPYAKIVSPQEEAKRLFNAIEIILNKYPDTIISVDTFRSLIVREAVVNFNVALINDISGGTLDELMFETVAEAGVAYVLMHSRGNPQTMQQLTNYENIVSEIILYLEKKMSQLQMFGVHDVIVDPGFGFAKTLEQNHIVLKKLSYFKDLNTPLMVGLSRKSMLYNLLETDAENALNATTAAHMIALMGGANILRVHDVKQAMEAIAIFNQYTNS